MQEPAWTKQIPNKYLCNWYYFFFVLAAVTSSIVLVAILYISFTMPISSMAVKFQLFNAVIMLAIGVTNALFFYLMCDRALKPGA